MFHRADILSDVTQEVDVERIHKTVIDSGQLEKICRRGQAKPAFPARDVAAVGKTNKEGHIALSETTGFAILAETIADARLVRRSHALCDYYVLLHRKPKRPLRKSEEKMSLMTRAVNNFTGGIVTQQQKRQAMTIDRLHNVSYLV